MIESSVSMGRSFESLRKQFYIQETKTWSVSHFNGHLFTTTMTHEFGVCKAYSLPYKGHFQCSFKATGRVNLSAALPRCVLIGAPSYRTDISLYLAFNIQFPIHLCRWWDSTKLPLSEVRDAALTPQLSFHTWLFLLTSASTCLSSLMTEEPFNLLATIFRSGLLHKRLKTIVTAARLHTLKEIDGVDAIVGGWVVVRNHCNSWHNYWEVWNMRLRSWSLVQRQLKEEPPLLSPTGSVLHPGGTQS